MPQPEVLGRNGTYAAIRKLHTRVAAWRQYLRANSASPEEEALLAAKMVGRWPSGAPLVLSPEQDDPELGADYRRNNDFLYRADDDRGFKCPAGAHIRRVNPRDADIIGVTRLHRIIRRGTTYGPPLPAGVLEDDGADRGLVGVFLGAHLDRQFEFIKTDWVNDGNFIGYSGEKDPVAGHRGGTDDLHHPGAAHPAPPAEPAELRRHPRRRVRLRTGIARPALAGGPGHLIGVDRPTMRPRSPLPAALSQEAA